METTTADEKRTMDPGDVAALKSDLNRSLDDFYMNLCLEYHQNVLKNRYDTTTTADSSTKHPPRSSQDLLADTTVRSFQTEVVLQVLKWAGMTVREDLRDIALHYVPLHPNIAAHLARINDSREEDVQKLLAQILVPKDKLLRLLYNVAKKNRYVVAFLLAIDGLIENNVNNKYDYKRYMDRLRFDFDYSSSSNDRYASWWTRNDQDERFHVMAVRNMYNVLLTTYNKTDGQQYSAEDYMRFVNINVRSVLDPESISPEEKAHVNSDLASLYVNTMGSSGDHAAERIYRLSKKFIQKNAAQDEDKMFYTPFTATTSFA